MSAAQGLVSKMPVGGAASLCHCGLAPQPDLGCASALIHFPSLISSSHCLPSSLSSAKCHCGPSPSGHSSDRQMGILPHSKPCASQLLEQTLLSDLGFMAFLSAYTLLSCILRLPSQV